MKKQLSFLLFLLLIPLASAITTYEGVDLRINNVTYQSQQPQNFTYRKIIENTFLANSINSTITGNTTIKIIKFEHDNVTLNVTGGKTIFDFGGIDSNLLFRYNETNLSNHNFTLNLSDWWLLYTYVNESATPPATTPPTGGNGETPEVEKPTVNITTNVTAPPTEGICYIKDFFKSPTRKEWILYSIIGLFLLFSVIMMFASIDLFQKISKDKTIASKKARFWTAIILLLLFGGSYFAISNFDTYGCLSSWNKLIVAGVLLAFFILVYIIFLFIDFARK